MEIDLTGVNLPPKGSALPDRLLLFRQRRNTGRAFTLFEVLMAMGIFALVVIGAMAALNAALSAAREARIEQHARIQIESRLALLEGGPIQEIERVVETETPKMTFTETVKRENVVGKNSTVLNGFWRVRVVAKWKDGEEERSQEASFLRAGL